MDHCKVEMLHIAQSFSGAEILEGAALRLQSGEIHALLGEHGAGKTALIRILCGLTEPKAGVIRIDGKETKIGSARAGRRLGIGLIAANAPLVGTMTVMENFRMEAQGKRGLSAREIRKRAASWGGEEKLRIPLDARAETLSPVERLYAHLFFQLCREAEILILDAPAALLTVRQREELFRFLKRLAAAGKTILVTDWRPERVLPWADRCTVLRRGTCAGTMKAAETNATALYRLMTGDSPAAPVRRELTPGGIVLEVRGVEAPGYFGGRGIRDVSLEVRSGEIVGLLGLPFGGQKDFLAALMGLSPVRRGRIRLNGAEITHASCADRFRDGINYLPGSGRKGWVEDLPAEDNLLLHRYREPAFQDGGWMRTSERRRCAEELAEDAFSGPLNAAGRKMAAAVRALDRDAALLAVESPGEGLGEADRMALYRRILDVRDRRRAVLLMTEDPQEALLLADRILLFSGGEIVGDADPAMTAENDLDAFLSGAIRQEKYGGVEEEIMDE